ncbi:AAA family ATPase [Lachnospiraceae bacterium SGI.240]
MKRITLLSMDIQNFKGCTGRTIDFADKTKICGANATGKTTIFDAFTFLLFNRDSLGSSDFDIRPLDADGKMIDNIEISVKARISVDDEEFELKKVQKQKWVKKRGTDSREFQGNQNEFEINGYPKSQKEFKEFISEIVDEDVFNLITNPAAFNSLPWKKQRETLMEFVGDFTDEQIAGTFGERYATLIPELRIASTDDILKKYTKAKSLLNKTMVELPARIDEVSKQLVIADVGALEVEKAAKEAELSKVEADLSGGNGKTGEINSKREEIMNLKFHLSEIQNKANQKLFDDSAQIREEVDKKREVVENLLHELSVVRDNGRTVQSEYHAHENDVKRLLNDWKAEKAKKFPEFVPLEPLSDSATVCPTCGQELPEDVKKKNIADYEARKQAHEDDYNKRKADFEADHEKKLADITKAGSDAAKLRDEAKDKWGTFESAVKTYEQKIEEAKRVYGEEKSKLDKIPKVADISNNAEYKATNEKISALEKEITELSSVVYDNAELEAKKSILKDEIAEIAGKILAADNSKVKERIAELEAEQKEVGQKIANQEMMIDLVEDFIRTKMNMISEKINEMFKIVSFKMFAEQINGGIKETCECTVNGVPLSSLNNGHRIVAGLDIIHSLSNLYGVSCPIFVDNAESINDFNVPEMDAQMIYLTVTDDKELKVADG